MSERRNEAEQVAYLNDLIAKHGKVGENESLTDAGRWFVACYLADTMCDLSFKDMARELMNGIPAVDDGVVASVVMEFIWDPDAEEAVEGGEEQLITSIVEFFQPHTPQQRPDPGDPDNYYVVE